MLVVPQQITIVSNDELLKGIGKREGADGGLELLLKEHRKFTGEVGELILKIFSDTKHQDGS